MQEAESAARLRAEGEFRALAALLTGAVAIGLAPILVRWSEVGPSASAFWRTALAAPLFLLLPLLVPVATGARKRVPQGLREVMALMLAGAFFAGDLAFWHASLLRTSVANATLFTNAAPVLVTAAAFFLFGERLTLRFLAGLCIAVIGSVLVLGDSLARGGSAIEGDGLAFISALFYASYLLTVARLRQAFDTLTLMAWSSFASALVLLPVAAWFGETLLPATAVGVLVLLALAWFSQLAGQGLIAYALAHLPVSFSSLGLLLQPASAALFAWLLLAEPLQLLQAVGAAVILAGIALARPGS